jgi:hypothetical protein
MDLLSLVAASRPNLETNGAATTKEIPADVARRNIWGGPDVDVPAEGPLDYGSVGSDDHEEEPKPSDDHEEEPEPSEEDSSNAGELKSGADEPNNAGHFQEEKDDDEPSGRLERVPRSWLTIPDGEQQQHKRAKPYKPILEDYVLDIPFNDYAFYPGTLFYPDEGICLIVSQHPVHFLLVS